MVLFGLLIFIMTIGIFSSQISPINLNRITIIVLLLSGVLAFHAMWVGQLGSGVGIFNGLFQVTFVTQGFDLFIYIVGVLVLFMSETQVNNNLQLNKEKLTLNGVVSFNHSPSVTTGGSMPSSLAIIGEFPIIVLFSVLGMTLLISSYDLLSLYLSLELQSFAVYVLATLYRDSESATSAGLRYFLLGSLSSAIILLGSGLVYSYTGLTSFEGLYLLCSQPDGLANQYLEFSVLLIIVGMLFKVAAAPFHNWSISVYDGVPTIVTAWLTTMPKISLFLFLLEFQGFAVLYSWSTYTQLLLLSSILSLIIGTVGGLSQYRIKRLIAYSTISHVGFLILALAINSESSVESFLFYLIQYSLTNVSLFFILISLGSRLVTFIDSYSPIQFISQLKGQISVSALMAISLAICFFSLMGIPPMVGFFAKLSVLQAALYNGNYFIVIVAIITTVISATYYLYVIRVIYFDSSERVDTLPIDNVSSFIIATLTLMIFFFIFNPNILLNSLHLLTLSLFTV